MYKSKLFFFVLIFSFVLFTQVASPPPLRPLTDIIELYNQTMESEGTATTTEAQPMLADKHVDSSSASPHLNFFGLGASCLLLAFRSYI